MALKRRYKGFDYAAKGHPDLSPRAPAQDDIADTTTAADSESKWVHKGGGYYEHTVTGDVIRGNPDA